MSDVHRPRGSGAVRHARPPRGIGAVRHARPPRGSGAVRHARPPRGIGNDVVDLRDRDARPETLHPRFDAKVFHASERAFIGAGAGANRRRWSLWAAKEAAHKALRQERPELGFAPRHYRVELDARGAGTVRRGAEVFSVRVAASAEQVHAVAFRADAGDVVDAVANLAELGEADPSRAVRTLLQRSLAGAAEVALERRGRIPRLRLDGRMVAVSFSHHGRFVAVARGPEPVCARAAEPA